MGTPLSAPPVQVDTLPITDAEMLSTPERSLRARAIAHGLDGARAATFELAVHEIAANSLVHGPHGGTLRLWATDRAVVCHVEGDGSIGDPEASRQRPAPDTLRGRDLWLANQLCDLVQIRSIGSGTVVRVHMWRDSPRA